MIKKYSETYLIQTSMGPTFLFFFSIQQNFITEDYLVVFWIYRHMCSEITG